MVTSTPMFARLRAGATQLTSSSCGSAAILVGSIAVAGGYVVHSFGASRLIDSIADANVWLVALAIAIGALIQVIRAQRARSMLSHGETVTLGQTYGAMVVGHGIGDL